MTGPEKEALEVLTPFLGDELSKDIISHRRGMKAPLTARGARSLIKEYQKTGHTVAAAEMHLNRGWRGFDASFLTGVEICLMFSQHRRHSKPVTPSLHRSVTCSFSFALSKSGA